MSNENPTTVRPPKRGSASNRVLEAANDLFYRQGIRAVGVDQIVKTADVAKISMYRSFLSKDDLIVAYLQDRDVAFWRGWDSAVAEADEAEDQLRAALNFIRVSIATPGYRGCPFANFCSEYPDRDHAGHRVVEASKSGLREALFTICDRMEVRDSRRLADALFLLLEGAFAVSQTTAREQLSAGDALVWSAEALLAAQKSDSRQERTKQ